MKIAVLKETFDAFNEDKVPRLAAAIAYSTLFSIAPLFIVLIAIAGAFIGSHSQVQKQLVDQVAKVAGAGAGDAVRQIVEASFNKPRQGAIAQTIGWIAFAFGASGLFASLQGSLNSIWHVESTKGGWLRMVRDRAASFGMILIVGFLLVLTVVANSVIAFVSTHFASALPQVANPVVITVAYEIVTLIILTVVFALIYKVLPDVNVAWRDVFIGAAATAVLFMIGQALILLYLTKAGVGSAYGAAGSVMVVLLWIYYSAIILLLGAEFTKVTAKDVELVEISMVSESNEQAAGTDPRYAGKAS